MSGADCMPLKMSGLYGTKSASDVCGRLHNRYQHGRGYEDGHHDDDDDDDITVE